MLMGQGVKIPKVQFIKSAFKPTDYPPPGLPEVAVTGRSNSGKSTLINAMTGRKIAKVSQTAGKTTLLNFYQIDELYCLVDMPGYGYAARGARQIKKWQEMIEHYLSMRSTLKAVVLTMDIRRDWSDDEEMLCRWLGEIGQPVVIILTKADKLSYSQKQKRLAAIKKQSQQKHILCASVKDGQTYRAIDLHLRKMV
jgi:GTP-binding protein